MLYAGVDIGSTTSKAVLTDESGELLQFFLMDTLLDREESGQAVLNGLLYAAGKKREEITSIVATGYGRKLYKEADGNQPEIICHALGTKKLIPSVRCILDIGGQDSKVIELDDMGNVIRFEMNDKCAAGTGRFFEVLTTRLLHIPMDELSDLVCQAANPSTISSMCTIFAETEIVSYLSQGEAKENIAAGTCQAVAKRVLQLAKSARIELKDTIAFTGGAAKNEGIRQIFEKLTGKEVVTLQDPQATAAYGAALIARKMYK